MIKTQEQMQGISMVVAAEMQRQGVESVSLVADNGKSGDAAVRVWRYVDVLVATTNGGAIWEDDADFTTLVAAEGITL